MQILNQSQTALNLPNFTQRLKKFVFPCKRRKKLHQQRGRQTIDRARGREGERGSVRENERHIDWQAKVVAGVRAVEVWSQGFSQRFYEWAQRSANIWQIPRMRCLLMLSSRLNSMGCRPVILMRIAGSCGWQHKAVTEAEAESLLRWEHMHAQAYMYCMYFQFAIDQGGVSKTKLKFALQFNRGVIYISHLVHFLQHSICLARLQPLLLLFMQAATRGAHHRQANGRTMPPD